MEDNAIVEISLGLVKEIFTVLSESSVHLPQKYVDNVRNGLNKAAQEAHAKLQREKIEAEQKAKEEADKKAKEEADKKAKEELDKAE